MESDDDTKRRMKVERWLKELVTVHPESRRLGILRSAHAEMSRTKRDSSIQYIKKFFSKEWRLRAGVV